MKPAIENSPGPLTEKILLDQEFVWGFTLPESYRTFLLRFNGGIAKPSKFPLSASDSSNLECFFSLNEIIESKSYLYMPEAYLPVARDKWCNVIFININGSERGTVHFRDNEVLDSEFSSLEYALADIPYEAKLKATRCIAKSFDDFLNSF